MPDSNNDCMSVGPGCDVQDTIYGYYPNLGANLFFAIFFGIFLIVQTGLGVTRKSWFFTGAMMFGCFGECVGYIGRIILHSNPYSNTGFEMQICCLICSPAFFSAAIYFTLKHFVRAFGPEFSRIPLKYYTWIFIGCDIFSLCLQAIGGGIAASSNTSTGSNNGAHIMLTGIILQVVTLFLFGALAFEYFARVFKQRGNLNPTAIEILQDSRTKYFSGAISLAYVALLIRCIYRIPELSGGWANPIMRDETDFIVLDGVMCVIVTLCLTIFHPGYFFPIMQTQTGIGKKKIRSASDSDLETSVAPNKVET